MIFFGSKQTEQKLKRVVQDSPELEVMISTNNETTLFALLNEYHPHLVLLENSPETPNLIELIEKIRCDYPRSNLLILADEIDVALVRESISVGVLGYLLIDSALNGLETCLSLVNSGKLTLSSEVTCALLSA